MNELKKIYWHEKELLIAIPMLISNATTFELVEMLTVQIIYLRKHLKELERKFPFINQMETQKNLPKNNQINRIAIP
jgi:ferritin-like metal-binding protein YciE